MKVIPIQFGEIAVQEGYIQPQQLQEGLKVQKLYREPKRLGEILIEKGYMQQKDTDRVLKMQQVYKSRLESEYFAHLAIKNKSLNSLQLKELRRLYLEEDSVDKPITIAALAVKQGYLSMPLAEEILKSAEYQNSYRLKLQGKTVLGGYELIGGITKLKKANIYKAVQVELERLVAVKVLQKEYETAEHIRKFFGEAKATAHFNHPNLVRIYDVGIEENGYYYAMELVEGENLTAILDRDERLQVGESVRIIRQIASALEHMHVYKTIHSQVNPRNIMIRDDKIAKLLDLSASCSIEAQKASAGKLNKMPQYTAPEQVTPGMTLDVRTDIYSLGCTFYRMLTGHAPVSGKTVEEISKNILDKEPTPIGEIDYTIPEDLSKIVHRMMRKDPTKRYQNIKGVLFALRKILV